MNVQKIVPHLWFDREVKEAVEFYTAIFPDSRITSSVVLPNTPPGDTLVYTFSLNGYTFMAINGGSYFKINPSISFMVNFDPARDGKARDNLDVLWENLSQDGLVLMPLQEYPFSKRYGWIQDKFGLSWQLILTDPDGEERPFIMPSLLFVQDVCGKAEEAVNFYLSVFQDTRRGLIARYPAGMEPDMEGTVMFSDFLLEKQWFTAMDSARNHDFKFNEAISFLVRCDSQEEIDYYWDRLSADPQAEQCGWLKDKYGLSWQVSPMQLEIMLDNGTENQINSLMEEFLEMKKIDLGKLQEAYGNSSRV